jgi:hypothetical protein
MVGLYNLIDDAMAQELGVDVKTYIEVIDKNARKKKQHLSLILSWTKM